jgi:Transposase, Mutator family
VELVGPDGLLTGLTKTVIETALEAETSEHLGYDRHDSPPVTVSPRSGRVTTMTSLRGWAKSVTPTRTTPELGTMRTHTWSGVLRRRYARCTIAQASQSTES